MASIQDIVDITQAVNSISNVATSLLSSNSQEYVNNATDAINRSYGSLSTPVRNGLSSLTQLAGIDRVSSIPINQVTNEPINYKVRLVSVLGLKTAFSSNDLYSVIFDNTPDFSESGSVTYTPTSPVHMPGSIQSYKSTDSRTFSISSDLISRNTADVSKNMRYLQILRSWRYPFFGKSGSTSSGQQSAFNRIQSSGNVNLLGAPPEILYLYAYSTSNNDSRQLNGQLVNINRLPVVLTSLSITYPKDVDYLPSTPTPTGVTEPFPVKLSIQISLTEAHSPVEYERFDLMAYKSGTLKNF